MNNSILCLVITFFFATGCQSGFSRLQISVPNINLFPDHQQVLCLHWEAVGDDTNIEYEFELYRSDGDSLDYSHKNTIGIIYSPCWTRVCTGVTSNSYAEYPRGCIDGGKWRVRAYDKKTKLYSNWSNFSFFSFPVAKHLIVPIANEYRNKGTDIPHCGAGSN